MAARASLTQGDLFTLRPGRVTLVYIVEGSVQEHPSLEFGCRLTVDLTSRLMAITSADEGARWVAGDAFITFGRRPFALETDRYAKLTAVDIELSNVAVNLSALLPEFFAVTGFDSLEPAAAALAEHMGDAGNCSLRSGNPVICRMMVTIVLLAIIRAWAENGCAPEGWSSRATDPFLDRVLGAIHDEPGRNWSVEILADVGIMSRSVFAERFRRAIGSSPANYVRRVRMEVAKGMLSAGRSVSETSRELGYASDEGFSRAFRRRTGLAPSGWRIAQRTDIFPS